MDDAVGVVVAEAPSGVRLTLGDDGVARLRLDCNRGRAEYTVSPAGAESGTLTFGPVAATRMACRGDGLADRFARDAEAVRSYLLREGRLYLSLLADAGIYAFDPVPPIASVEDGGARMFVVAGAPSGLRLRAQPSVGADVLGTFAEGALLDNLGCVEGEARRWCLVQPFGGGPVGQVAAEFLAPATGPDGSMPAGPDDSTLRAGEGEFDATGRLPCGDDDCAFGVARAGGGFATVVITRPDGRRRVLFFRLGRATGADTSEADGYPAFSSVREGDDFLVRVGAERYRVPEAVVLGG